MPLASLIAGLLMLSHRGSMPNLCPDRGETTADQIEYKGMTLAKVTLATPVICHGGAKEGDVSFPLPNEYRGQRVLAFRLQAEPAEALKSWHWEDRKDGLNRICVAHVAPTGRGVMLTYNAYIALPHAANDPRTGDPNAWLGRSACVQSDDAEILAKANELKTAYKDRADLVKATVDWVAQNEGRPGATFTQLDAVAGLKCGGSCTNHANLCAALLRANGIPARTVAHMPTWYKDKFDEHWLTEYWTEGKGWRMVEPTLGRLDPERDTVVVLAISSVADENKAFDTIHERVSMPGSAYLSLPEITAELDTSYYLRTGALNSVSLVRTWRAVPHEAENLASLSRRAKQVEALGRAGRNSLTKSQEAELVAQADLEKLVAWCNRG